MGRFGMINKSMRKFLIVTALVVSLMGCRAAVPVSFANKVKCHNRHVQKLHTMLNGYLKQEIATIDSKLLYGDLKDKKELLLLRAYFEEKLFLVHVDKQFSDWIEKWAVRHQWEMAISRSDQRSAE